MNKELRVRIAPSPTGEPHVGTAYIALLNRCLAKARGGSFILRIEDTDRERSTRESEDAIFRALAWLGLTWDEGPDVGGPYGPYRQSERTSIYRSHTDDLIARGCAYRCFCTREDLEAMRARQTAEGRDPGYFAADSPCRNLTPAEVKEKEEKGLPSVVRLKVPEKDRDDEVSFFDKTRRKAITRKYSEIDDQILLKSDGFPTYHLANVVDDHLMNISVVMRGEEWIPSTFKHVLLYEAFGWEQPEFYHLSLLRNTDKNKSKISKRKNPVSLNWFRAAGYTPAALLNFLALMGYSRDVEGKSQEEIKEIELFTIDELIAEFDPARISTTGPAFDYEKLNAFNESYLQKMGDNEFRDYLCSRTSYLIEYLGDLLPHVRVRFKRCERELGFWTDFLFKLHLSYSVEEFRRVGLPFKDMAAMAGKLKKAFKAGADTVRSVEDFKSLVQNVQGEAGFESKPLHMVLRLAVLGSSESLPLYEAMGALGIYRCMARLDDASLFLNANLKAG